MAERPLGPMRVQPSVSVPGSTAVFQSAQVDRTNKWESLARALGAIGQGIDQAERYGKAADKEEALAEGRALYEKNRMDYKQAVEQGLIPEGSNPHLKLAYEKLELQNKAQEAGRQMHIAFINSEASKSNDSGAYQEWVDGYRKDVLKEMGESYSNAQLSSGFFPVLRQHEASLQQRWIQHRQQAIADKAKEAFSLNITGKLSNLVGASAADIKAVGEDISMVAAEMVGVMKGSKVNDMIIDAVAAEVEATGNTQLWGALRHVKTGSGTLDGKGYARKKKHDVNARLVAARRAAENAAHAREARERERISRQIGGKIVDVLSRDPLEDITQYTSALYKSDPDAAAGWINLQTKWQRDLYYQNERPGLYTEAMGRVMKGEDPLTFFTTWASQGVQISQRTLSEVFRAHERQSSTRGITLNKGFTTADKHLEKLVGIPDAFASILDKRGALTDGQILYMEKRQELLTWVQSWVHRNLGPGEYNVPPEKQIDFEKEIGEAVRQITEEVLEQRAALEALDESSQVSHATTAEKVAPRDSNPPKSLNNRFRNNQQ